MKNIKKLVLKNHDLESMVRNIAFMLRMLAMNIDGRHNKRIPTIYYIITVASLVCYFYAFQVSLFWFIFWRGQGETRLEKTILFCLGTMTLMGVAKFIYMYLKRDGLQKVVAAYLLCDSQVVPQTRMSKSMDASLRAVKKRAVLFWAMIMGNTVVYFTMPLLLPGRHLTEDNQVIWGLEPMHESPNYEIAYIMVIFCIPVVVLAPVSLTSFLIVIIGYTEAQLTALSQEMLNLWEDAQSDYEQKAQETNQVILAGNKRVMVNRFAKGRLEAIIKGHATNKQLIKQVEDIYSNAIAISFILLSTSLVTALLGGLENTYLLIPFSMVQVAMDCITGQRLLDANSNFAAAVYQCRWENLDVGNMKLLLVMLQSAQNTMKLSAGEVVWLSYSSLMAVIKTIYSTYTAFR